MEKNSCLKADDLPGEGATVAGGAGIIAAAVHAVRVRPAVGG